uniref:Methionine aminopeptidase n=1 Tax=Lotharella globosa TaxID=91324 RepID=A0A7S3YZI5_9EUKA
MSAIARWPRGGMATCCCVSMLAMVVALLVYRDTQLNPHHALRSSGPLSSSSSSSSSVRTAHLGIIRRSMSLMPRRTFVDRSSPYSQHAEPSLSRRCQAYGQGFGASSTSNSNPKKKNKQKEKKKSAIGRMLRVDDSFGGFRYTGSLKPGQQSPRRRVDDGIAVPEYHKSGTPSNNGIAPWDKIEVKSAEDIKKMRAAGKIAREILDAAGRMVKPGVTTDSIDALVHSMCMERNCYPSPLNYNHFPKSVCTSINEVICHGIPDSTVLKEGDIVNIDVTVFHDGFHGDCSEMFGVGEIDDESKRLIQVTYDAWQEAIAYCKPGARYNQIGGIIEEHVTKHGYSSSPDFVAHGIGRKFHTKPFILHCKNNENLGKMEPGHVFTIEPMICQGTSSFVMWPDNWTAATKDGKRAAQFEHTFLITKDGIEALTGKLPDSPVQFWENPETRVAL